MKSVQMRRPSLAYGQNKELMERQISILPAAQAYESQHKTDFALRISYFLILTWPHGFSFLIPMIQRAISCMQRSNGFNVTPIMGCFEVCLWG